MFQRKHSNAHKNLSIKISWESLKPRMKFDTKFNQLQRQSEENETKMHNPIGTDNSQRM